MKAFLLSSLVFFTSFFCFSQDQIYLINGGILEGKVTSMEGVFLLYHVKKGDKVKQRRVEKERVYSVYKKSGEKKVLYKPNPEIGLDLSVEEMQYYVYGAQDAIKNYKGRGNFIAGLAIAAGGTAAGRGSFPISLGSLGVGILGASIPKIKAKEGMVRDANLINNEFYVSGFEDTAKKRKVLQAVAGAFIGWGITLTAFGVTGNL